MSEQGRLAQILSEIINAKDCPYDLRDILNKVKELDSDISYMDASDFDEWFESQDFADRMFEDFGVTVSQPDNDDGTILDEVVDTIYSEYKDEAMFEQAVDLVIEQLENMGLIEGEYFTEEDVITSVSRYTWL